jgi:hypothetical protein
MRPLAIKGISPVLHSSSSGVEPEPLTEKLANKGSLVLLAADHTKVGKISHRW